MPGIGPRLVVHAEARVKQTVLPDSPAIHGAHLHNRRRALVTVAPELEHTRNRDLPRLHRRWRGGIEGRERVPVRNAHGG
ncbi:MAG: hypothetical protein ABF893_01725 [Gluconacetobacter liquefaciens]